MDAQLRYEKDTSNSIHFINSRNEKVQDKSKACLVRQRMRLPVTVMEVFLHKSYPNKGVWWTTGCAAEIEDQVLSLYSHAMSTRDIENHIKELYDVDMSVATITNYRPYHWAYIPMEESPVEKCLHGRIAVPVDRWMQLSKVRPDGKVINKAVQIAVGLKNEGKKEILGMWTCQNESVSFWLSVLTNPKKPGYWRYLD